MHISPGLLSHVLYETSHKQATFVLFSSNVAIQTYTNINKHTITHTHMHTQTTTQTHTNTQTHRQTHKHTNTNTYKTTHTSLQLIAHVRDGVIHAALVGLFAALRQQAPLPAIKSTDVFLCEERF